MKFAEQIFPKGTFKDQKSDGAFIEDAMAANLDVYAKKIAEDMHFLLIITGNDSVGNGKTTEATHTGSYLTDKINKLHNIDNTFTHRNMVFNSKTLVERSFELPKYSVIVLDEGDDLTEHGMKTTAQNLKRYFRKCRQLNQILILILPSFFELPKFYALSRSHCLINVMFKGEFDRGFFNFYGPKTKKLLYLKGKKEWDYECVNPDFGGRFFGSYCFFPNCKHETELYLKNKHQDMVNDADEHKELNQKQIEKQTTIRLFKQIHENLSNISVKTLAGAFGIGTTTAFRWLSDDKEDSLSEEDNSIPNEPDYINYCNNKKNILAGLIENNNNIICTGSTP